MGEPRILFVTRKWAPAVGGMETYAMRLTEALAEIEPVQVVALPGRADGMPPGVLALLGFPLKVMLALLRRRVMPEVVHLADMAIWPLGVVAKFLAPRARIVLSAHGTDVSYHRRGGIKGRLYGRYMRLGARLLHGATIIANSRATRDVAAETGWQASHVVPLATDLRGALPDGTHNGRLLFVGRLVERKGCGWFVREVLPLLDERIVLDVAGTGWDEAERAVLDHPRVNYLGALHGSDLARAYREAMCVIVPNIETESSEYEGFGLVAPEAAACGGLVLAADCGGLRDAVLDGDTGMLLRSGDAAVWAEAIGRVERLAQCERTEMAGRAMRSAAEVYSWRRVAVETLAGYAMLRRPESPVAIAQSLV